MGISDGMFTGDVWRAIGDLRRQIRNLTSGRRLEDASIGARGIRLIADPDGEGGKLTVDGGSVVMRSPDGIDIFYVGNVHADDDTSRGVIIRYDNNAAAIATQGSPGKQFLAVRDLDSNIVLATDATSGAGLAQPYLNIPMYPSTASQHNSGGPFWPSTNSASYVELMHGFTTVWHPRLRFGMDTASSAGATEWRLLLSGELIATGSGDVSATYDIPGWGEDGGTNPGDERVVQVEVRNVGGGISWAQADKCYGLKS